MDDVDLSNLCRLDAAAQPATAVQELLRSLVVRTNLVPGVRHVLGWRGLKDSSHGAEAWTMRARGRDGVFGLVFDTVQDDGGWLRGQFNLCYFPHPEEDLVERVCVQASMATSSPEYLTRVREFSRHEDLLDLFNIGRLELGLRPDGAGAMVAVECLTRQRVVARDGVLVEQPGRPPLELVAPGGFDQDFPAWEVSLDLFEVLAASLSFNLGAAPTSMARAGRAGWVRTYDRIGQVTETEADHNPQQRLTLGWGQAALPAIPSWPSPMIWRPDDDPTGVEFTDALWWSSHQCRDLKAVDKHALGIDERPRLIVLTGFLGSGKTTFLQHFIDHQNRNNRFVAVIQNEVGEVGLDGGLLDHDYAVTEIDEGCICCTLVGNVKKALHHLMGEFHPDTIVLETTGLANPLNLLDELAEVADLVRFDSVTTLVDGVNLDSALADSHVAREQIRAADAVLLNKADLLDAAAIDRITALVRQINPAAPVIPTVQGDINPALLYGDDPESLAAMASDGGPAGHQHGPDHRHDHFGTCKLTFDRPLTAAQLARGLTGMPDGVFRVKGVVWLDGRPRPQVVQMVAGRHEISDHPGRVDDDSPGYLVCIGRELEPEALQRLFGEG